MRPANGAGNQNSYYYSNTAVNSGLNLFSSVARYVIGFEPGSKSSISSSLTPFSGLNGAITGNAIETLTGLKTGCGEHLLVLDALVMSANALTPGTLFKASSGWHQDSQDR